MNQKLQEAIDALPLEIVNTAEKMFQTYAGQYPARRNPGRIYLKQAILARYPNFRFKTPIPEIEEKTRHKEQVQGEKIKATVCKREVNAITNTKSGEIIVCRSSLCKAFGWHSKKLTDLAIGSPRRRELAAAGYSFREYVAFAQGKRQKSPFISLADATVAVNLYESKQLT